MNKLLLTSMMLSASWPAWASAQGNVIDSAKLFSKEGVAAAQQSIKAFRDRTGLDFVVETIASVDDVSSGKSSASAGDQDRALTRAAESRATSKGVRGLYVLICKDPGKLKYFLTNQTLRKQDAEAVKSAMIASLESKEFDQALTAATTTLGRLNVSSAAPARGTGNRSAESGGGNMIWTLLLVGLGIWLLFGLFRGMSSAGAGGGGGFFQSMLGGMFGGMAGMWMYDSFFRGGGSGYSGDGGSDGGISGGGDWGDSGSGGGDWGGGGGGDYGGSGDF